MPYTFGDRLPAEKVEAINTLLELGLPFANENIGRYGVMKDLSMQVGGGFRATIALKGISQSITANVEKITIADDNSSITLSGLSSDVEFLNNLLRDYVEGQDFSLKELPDIAKKVISVVKVLL